MKTNDKKPIFFTGQMRSGGTLLTRIFEQSDELRVAYNTVHYMRFSYKKFEPIESNYENLLNAMNGRLKDRWELSLNVQSIKKTISGYSKIDEATVYDSIMKSFLNISDNDNIRWADRTAVKWEGIKPFLEMFPNGKAVHIYRDPRAVLASYKHMTYLPEPMYLDIIFSTLSMFKFLSSEDCLTSRVLLIKYEDLIEEPQKVVINACDFLDIKYKEEMLDVSKFKDFKGQKFDGNSAFVAQKTSIDKTSKSLWKDKLTNIELYLTEMILKQYMLFFGYELSGVDLSKSEFNELYDLLHEEYIYKRYAYWLKNGNGQESHPDTDGAYECDI